jgi:hypothetical protein
LKSHEVGEKSHVLVGQRDKEAGVITADHILTSSKKNYITGKPNITIDTDNYKKLGKPQRVAELETSRFFLESDKGITFEVVSDATSYMQLPHITPKSNIL